jgi:hypothetical protein
MWGKTIIGQGFDCYQTHEIGPCTECGGCGEVSCCEGVAIHGESRAETMILAGELCDGTIIAGECNPNDDGC